MVVPEPLVEVAPEPVRRRRRWPLRLLIGAVVLVLLWVVVALGWAAADRRAFEQRAQTIVTAWTASPDLIAQGKAGTLFVPLGIGERWGENGNTPINYVVGTGTGVTVHVVGGACDTLPWKVQVYETEQLVVLGARPDAPPYPAPWTWQLGPGGCTSNAVDRPVDVVLSAPIGDRLVVQAWSGAPVPQHP